MDRDRTEGWFSEDPEEIRDRFGGRWLTADVRAGDIITFGLYTLHGSTNNTTNRFRLSLRRVFSARLGTDGRTLERRRCRRPLRERGHFHGRVPQALGAVDRDYGDANARRTFSVIRDTLLS